MSGYFANCASVAHSGDRVLSICPRAAAGGSELLAPGALMCLDEGAERSVDAADTRAPAA